MIDLRDAFHMLRLALSLQKYCGITPYYGSPTYLYLRMGMGMSVSPQIFQDDLIKRKQNFDVIMDDTFIHSTAEEHMDDLMDLFKVLRKYGLKLSPHKCQFFKKKIVYMGLEFQIEGDKVCYTPLKDKCDAIRNLESPKTLRQTRAFCGMVNFLSSFLPNLCRLLILIYNLQKKAKKFKWTEEARKTILFMSDCLGMCLQIIDNGVSIGTSAWGICVYLISGGSNGVNRFYLKIRVFF